MNWDRHGQAKFPLLGKGGVAARSRKSCKSTFERADGVVGSTSNNRWLNQPPRLRPAKEASRLLLMGASTPALPKKGNRMTLIPYARQSPAERESLASLEITSR